MWRCSGDAEETPAEGASFLSPSSSIGIKDAGTLRVNRGPSLVHLAMALQVKGASMENYNIVRRSSAQQR